MSDSPHGDHDLGRWDAAVYLRLLAESGSNGHHLDYCSDVRMPLLRFLRRHANRKQFEDGLG